MTESAPDDAERLEPKLLRAALERLADEPAERLSLRQIAQDLGVSHQAPYVHFGSRRRLLAAVEAERETTATSLVAVITEIAGLESQVNELQTQLAANEARQAELSATIPQLQADIATLEAKIARAGC